MDEERKNIEKELLLENMHKIDITIPEIKFFLKEMRNGKVDDINYCKMLANVLIYKVYLYDDNLTIIFNTQNKTYNEKIPLIEKLEEELSISSYKERRAEPSRANLIKRRFLQPNPLTWVNQVWVIYSIFLQNLSNCNSVSSSN